MRRADGALGLLLALALTAPVPSFADACGDCQRQCQKAADDCRNAGPKAFCRMGGFKVICKMFQNVQCRAAQKICVDINCGLLPNCGPGGPGGGGGGKIAGEPHLYSLDRARYDLQAAGEFVAARSARSDLELQARLTPYGSRVSVMSVLAIRIGGSVLTFERDRPVALDRREIQVPEQGLALGEEIILRQIRDGRYLLLAGDTGIWVHVKRGYLDLWFEPSPETRGEWSGLLGDFDGDPQNDFQTREGEVLEYGAMTPELLYGRFAMSWRLSQEESFLPYDQGETTETFTDLGFPPSHFQLADLDEAAFESAREICLAAGVPEGEPLRNCVYDVAVTGESEFTESYRDLPAVEGATPLQFAAPVGLRIPSRAQQGGTISAFWSGDPAGEGELALLDARGRRLAARSLQAGNPIKLRLPAEIGTYEVRLAQGERQLARQIEVAAAQATIQAPDTVGGAQEFAANWTGPLNEGDYLALMRSGETDSREALFRVWARSADQTMQAPVAAGKYELWYVVEGSDRAIPVARRPLQVNPVDASVEAVAVAPSGSDLEVRWAGPGNPDDYVSIADSAASGREYESYTYLSRGNPLTVTAPDAPGSYEVRYVHGRTGTVLARREVEVPAAEATLQAAAEVASGGALEVRWTGPGNPNDFISIAIPSEPGRRYENYTYIRRGSPLTVTAPDAPGAYELRYVQGQSRTVLAAQPVQVVAVEATLQAAAQIGSGSELEVSWTGPANPNDFISIAQPSSPDRRYENYSYTRRGNPLAVTVPDAPGRYELRYVQAQSRTVLARRPVEVLPVEARLEAPAQVTAGSEFEIRWSGPGNNGDYISIAEPSAPGNAYAGYRYTRRGNPLSLRAPEEPGRYELRYVQGQSRTVLERTEIRVVR